MNRTVRFLAVTLAALSNASGDEITIEDVTYKDVIVDKGRSAYYVRFPQDGRVINVPINQIDAGSVVVNEDPFYRDTLKARFEDAKARREAAIREAGGTLPADSPFNAPITEMGEASSRGTGSGRARSGGGGGGAGNGPPAAMVQQLLSGVGFQFGAPSGGSVTGTMGNGTSIELKGSPNLSSMIVRSSGPPMQLQAGLAQLGALMGPAGAQFAQFLQQNQGTLMSGGTASTTMDGIKVTVQTSAAGGGNMQATVTLSF